MAQAFPGSSQFLRSPDQEQQHLDDDSSTLQAIAYANNLHEQPP
jgi:hypothetical protein